MSNRFFYSIYMKNTDTILGAFGVLGIILLVMFAISGSANNRNAEEVVLDSDATVEEVKLTDAEVEQTEEVLVSQENDEITLNADGLRDGVTNLFNTTRPADNATGFTQSDTEVALNGNIGDEETINDSSTGSGGELRNNAKVEEQNVSDTTDVEPEETLATTVEDEEVDIAVNDDKKPGRISKFFSGLFGGDNESSDNVGGSAEDLDDEMNNGDNNVMAPGSYVVKSGDNLWDILRTSGMTSAQTANYINDLRGDRSAMTDAGITSGNVDLIYVGQVLNL